MMEQKKENHPAESSTFTPSPPLSHHVSRSATSRQKPRKKASWIEFYLDKQKFAVDDKKLIAALFIPLSFFFSLSSRMQFLWL